MVNWTLHFRLTLLIRPKEPFKDVFLAQRILWFFVESYGVLSAVKVLLIAFLYFWSAASCSPWTQCVFLGIKRVPVNPWKPQNKTASSVGRKPEKTETELLFALLRNQSDVELTLLFYQHTNISFLEKTCFLILLRIFKHMSCTIAVTSLWMTFSAPDCFYDHRIEHMTWNWCKFVSLSALLVLWKVLPEWMFDWHVKDAIACWIFVKPKETVVSHRDPEINLTDQK